MRRIGFLCAASIAAVGVSTSAAQTPSRVIRLIDQRCAGCHVDARAERAPTVEGAPPPAALRRMTAETIFQAMTRGSMRAHVEDVADDVKRAMAEFLSGRKLGGTAGADARAMPNRCSSDRTVGDPLRWRIVEWMVARLGQRALSESRWPRAGRGAAPEAEMGVRVPRRDLDVRTAHYRRRARLHQRGYRLRLLARRCDGMCSLVLPGGDWRAKCHQRRTG